MINTDPPPGYLAHRGVLMGVVLIAFVAFGLYLATLVPDLVNWLFALTGLTRSAWQSWHWNLW